jgi:hypothetical protein
LAPFINEIPILLFEYEYRFTEYEYEYEKNHWYELPATIIPDGPKNPQCPYFLVFPGTAADSTLWDSKLLASSFEGHSRSSIESMI